MSITRQNLAHRWKRSRCYVMHDTIVLVGILYDEVMMIARAAAALHTGNPLPNGIEKKFDMSSADANPENMLAYAAMRLQEANAHQLGIACLPPDILYDPKNNKMLEPLHEKQGKVHEVLQMACDAVGGEIPDIGWSMDGIIENLRKKGAA